MKTGRDFIKIDNGNLWVINLNNMIPLNILVTKKISLTLDGVENLQDRNYINLLRDQIDWIDCNQEFIKRKANKLYHDYISGKLPTKIESRCVNFVALDKIVSDAQFF